MFLQKFIKNHFYTAKPAEYSKTPLILFGLSPVIDFGWFIIGQGGGAGVILVYNRVGVGGLRSSVLELVQNNNFSKPTFTGIPQHEVPMQQFVVSVNR